MTILQIAENYRQNAELLLARKKELEQQAKNEKNSMKLYRIRGRIQTMDSLYEEARSIALHLERTYGNGSTRRKRKK